MLVQVGTMFGREWVDNAGTLYSIDSSLRVSPKLPGVTISNGIVWAGTTMYYIDTMTFTVDAFDFDAASGAISNRRSIYHLPRDKSLGFADGMTLDADGNLWIACFNVGAPCVRLRLACSIKSCCFCCVCRAAVCCKLIPSVARACASWCCRRHK